MKISKKDLKALVKECLIEILAEGLGTSAYPQQMGGRPPASLPSDVPGNLVTSSRKIAESLSYGGKPAQPAVLPSEPVKSAVRELSAYRPDMASIFEDTARHTLQAQAAGERQTNMSALRGDMAAKVVDAATPDQLFGEETASKWAELAFMPSSKKI